MSYGVGDSIRRIMSKASESLGRLGGYFVASMTLIIAYSVFSRYLLGRGTLWADEVSIYLMIGIAYLGLAYTQQLGRHIRVDILVSKLGGQRRLATELATEIVGFAVVTILACSVYQLVWTSYHTGARFFSPLLTPLWLPQLALAVGVTFFWFQLLVQIYTSAQKLWRNRLGPTVS